MNDSGISITSINELESYCQSMISHSHVLADDFENLKRHANAITPLWPDRQQEAFMERLTVSAQEIQRLSEILNNYGRVIFRYCEDIRENNAAFLSKINF